SVLVENEGEKALLTEEVMISCTHGLLMCLDPESRLVFILAIILDLDRKEAAMILDMPADRFRQKLSRARKRIQQFMDQKCGLMNPANPCRCHRKIDFLSREGMIDPTALRFAPANHRTHQLANQIMALADAASLYRSIGDMNPSADFRQGMQQMIRDIFS
ncbi:MAG: sigma factor-like helix-turn-helix DNA-binding protein, partial [Bacteroidota bacterium]